jgi:pimeloyl-ACP methyl ester carboxylesterase
MRRGNTTTLYLLPGLMCDAEVWTHQQAHLAGLARIIVPDLRGFDTLPAMAEYILKRAPDHYAVAGHSMGGRVALELWKLAPERIEKLALLETGAGPLAKGEAVKRQALIDLALAGGMQAVAETWLPPLLHPARRRDKRLVNAITAMITRTRVADFVKQMQALIHRPDATGYLQHIQCTTLLLAGGYDALYPVEQHEQMQRLLPHAELVTLDDAGHMAPMETPEAVTAALREWLLL